MTAKKTIQPTVVGDLHERAVLVRCVEHTWMGGTIDRAVGKEVADAKGAQKDVGHFWLRLVPKSAIRPMANSANAVKAFYRSRTLPWLDGDVRMLPAAQLDSFLRELRTLIAERTKKEQEFFSQYEGWKEEARKTHGALFKEENYPSLDDLRSKFGFDIDVLPIPNVADWRVNLANDQAEELRKNVSQKYIELQQRAMRSLCESLMEVVEHMHTRLSDPEAKFKNSLVENVKEQLEIVSSLNVTDDKVLAAMVAEVKEKLGSAKPDELRDDKAKRQTVASDARSIMSKMAAYMGQAKQ